MLLKPLSVAAGLLAAPAVHAFLLPPEVSEADIEIANTLEELTPQITESQVVELECPGCPVVVEGWGGQPEEVVLTDAITHLEMTFAVDHQPGFDRLLVNGFELYPSGDPVNDALFAPQLLDLQTGDPDGEESKRHDDEHDHDYDRLEARPLGWGLRVSQPQKDAGGQFELVELDLQVVEVGVTFIADIPNIKIKLIKDASNRLAISQIEKTEPIKLVEIPTGGPEECQTLVCKMIAMAKESFKKLKSLGGCHGMKGGMKPTGGDMPHHPHGHHHPHPHGPPSDQWPPVPYRKHSWGKLAKNIGSHILLPVLIGIVAGVSVSL